LPARCRRYVVSTPRQTQKFHNHITSFQQEGKNGEEGRSHASERRHPSSR
jgi:hypothetical protein